MAYDILDEDYCLYCSRDYRSPAALQRHVARKHPGTYAARSIEQAKARLTAAAASTGRSRSGRS